MPQVHTPALAPEGCSSVCHQSAALLKLCPFSSTVTRVVVPEKALTPKVPAGTIPDIATNPCGRKSSPEDGRMTMMRTLLAGTLSVIFPAAMFAADTPGAMVYSHGTALVNGNNIARSSALFLGDLVQTRSDSVANISATGSSVIVLNDSLVQYEGARVKLEHGGVTVSTSKSMSARVGLVTVLPATAALTEFDIRDVDGTVHITARRGDLTVSDAAGVAKLAEGQQTTRDEGPSQDDSQPPTSRKKRKKPAAGTSPGAEGGILNSPIAVGVGGGLIIGGTIWLLTKSDDPVSPVNPQP